MNDPICCYLNRKWWIWFGFGFGIGIVLMVIQWNVNKFDNRGTKSNILNNRQLWSKNSPMIMVIKYIRMYWISYKVYMFLIFRFGFGLDCCYFCCCCCCCFLSLVNFRNCGHKWKCLRFDKLVCTTYTLFQTEYWTAFKMEKCILYTGNGNKRKQLLLQIENFIEMVAVIIFNNFIIFRKRNNLDK